MVSLTSYAVEVELSGVGGGWTDITADVLLGSAPLSFFYGMTGAGPLDRVAGTGYCTFSLDNSAGNSGALLGYYSPMHSNCRSGFTWGIAVRVKFVYGGVTYYKWRGKIKEIDVQPGSKRDRVTFIRAVDWMEEAAGFKVQDVDVQTNVRSDQLFSAVLAVMPKQPAATSIQTGQDTYAVALQDLGDHPYATTVFQKIAQSELGYVYIVGDQTQGGTLTFENRSARMIGGPTNVFSFSNDMIEMMVPRGLDLLYNRVESLVHPKTLDAENTVIWSQAESVFPAIQPGETVTIWVDFRDNNQTLSRIGALSTETPVAMTDYEMSSALDGSGVDLTSSFTVTFTGFAATGKFVITSAAAVAGYIAFLQVRGIGIYDYAPVRARSEDTASQAAQGLTYVEIDMPYQESTYVGQGAAEYIQFLYGSPRPRVDAVKFFASNTSSMLTAALAREIGARIGIDETVTGVTQTIPASSNQYGFYIQSVAFDVLPSHSGPLVWCTWTLVPADSNAYWRLDVVGASELGDTTTLGYP